MACRKIEEDCKRSGERKQRGFDLTALSARNWTSKSFFATGDVIRVMGASGGGEQQFTGFDYVAAGDGYSGELEPAWPATGTVTDGTLSWSPVPVSNNSMLRDIDTVEWIEDGEMTVDDDEIVNTEGRQQVSAFHSGGVNGQKYLVIARVTYDDGSIEDFGIRWTIKD
jgi:hypothetical protein